MKQKLFSIFFSLALLLPLYGQATNQDSAQSDVGTIRLPFDGNHNVYFVSDANEMNKVSFVGENNRRNAPQVAWDFEPTFNPATEMTHNMDDGDVGTLDLWYMQFRRNGNSYPTFYFNLLFERGTTYNYGSVTGPPLGTYTVNNSGSGLNDHNFLGNVSGYQAKYYKDSKNYFTIRYGTITFYKGANGRPYIIAELNSDINGSNSGWLLRAVIGSPLTHSISVTKSPNITATITGTGSFVEGGSTTLTVSNVQSGYHFVRWEDGGNTSTNTSYTINNIQAAHNVTAVFAADNAPQYTITVQANNDAYCTVSGGGTYYAGTNVTISSASKNEHLYIFDMFMLEGEDEDQGEPSFNITVTGDATYTAYYRLANNGTITATASSAIAGTATASPSGSLTGGTAVTLTAVANDGYTFTGWDDDNNGTIDNTDPTRTVYVDGTKTYTAQFVEGVTIDIQAAMTSNHGFGWGYCFYYWAKTYGYDIMIRGADNLVYTENADFGISEINTSESYINDHGTTVRFTAFDARFYSQGGKKVLEANAVGNNGKNYHLILRGHSESYSNEQTEAYSQTYGSYAPEHDSENIYYFTTQNGSGDYYSVTWKSQIVFITDESLCGTIPSGIYQASDTWDDGTLLSDGYTYGNYKLNSSSFVYMPATGYAEVVNRDETYYVLVDGYNSAGYSFYQTIGTTPYSVTVSSNSNSYGSAGIVWHSSNCGDVAYGAGTQKFFNGNTITLTASANSGYEFWRWSDEDESVETSAYGASRDVTVSGNLTLQAIFTEEIISYTVTFLNYDDTELQSGTLEYGADITYSGVTPTKDADGDYLYTFAGWDTNADGTADYAADADLGTVSGAVTFKAVFDATPKNLTLQDMENADYYNDFAESYNGVEMNTVTYNRTFRGSIWSTLCLPFDVEDLDAQMDPVLSKVYEFRYAEGDASVGVDLHFYPTTSMNAGQGYLVRTASTMSGPFEFYDVTIDTERDNADYAVLEGDNNGTGVISLVGTLRKYVLDKDALASDAQRYMALKDNKIYYPGVNTTVPAYRAFFKIDSPTPVAPRVRIVVEDEQATPIEVIEMDGEGNLMPVSGEEVRKYIEDGVLIIERNGKRYNAVGAEL